MGSSKKSRSVKTTIATTPAAIVKTTVFDKSKVTLDSQMPENLTPEEELAWKKHQRALRNRQSALRSRNRKRKRMAMLELKVQELQDQIKKLEKENKKLQGELSVGVAKKLKLEPIPVQSGLVYSESAAFSHDSLGAFAPNRVLRYSHQQWKTRPEGTRICTKLCFLQRRQPIPLTPLDFLSSMNLPRASWTRVMNSLIPCKSETMRLSPVAGNGRSKVCCGVTYNIIE